MIIVDGVEAQIREAAVFIFSLVKLAKGLTKKAV